jgi:hypothetical protein
MGGSKVNDQASEFILKAADACKIAQAIASMAAIGPA